MDAPDRNQESLAEEAARPAADLPARPLRSPYHSVSLLLGLLLVLGLAALLRGISLDHYPGDDEALLITEALRMDREGGLRPPLSRSGPAAHYALLGMAAAGRALGLLPPPETLAQEWEELPAGQAREALRLARLTALLLGLLAVAGAFLAGYQCGGLPGALTAGFALAVAPLAVRQGRLLSPELATAGLMGCGIGLATWAVRARSVLPAAGAALSFGLCLGARAYGALLFVPLFLLFLELVPGPRARLRQGTLLALAFLGGLCLSCAGWLDTPGWWPEMLRAHLGGRPRPSFGLEGEASGWAFHFTRSLPGALGFPILTLAGLVGLFFGLRSRRYEWRFLFWSFWIFFVVVGGAQDRATRAVLPLAVLLAAGAGLFTASGWGKLRGHPGAAVLTLLVALMLVIPVPDLFREAWTLRRTDSRVQALAFLEKEARLAGGRLDLVALLPLLDDRPLPPGNPAPGREEYPALAAPLFRLHSLCQMRLGPQMDHHLWPVLETVRRGEGGPWDYYVWSGWVEGVLSEDYFGGPLAAARILMEHAEKEWSFGGPPVEAGTLLGSPAAQVITVPWAERPGPWIRIFRLRSQKRP